MPITIKGGYGQPTQGLTDVGVDESRRDIVAGDFFPITPSDSVNLIKATKGIYVGGAGNVSAVTRNGVTVLFTAVPVGSTLDIGAIRINATGTTATNLVGLA